MAAFAEFVDRAEFADRADLADRAEFADLVRLAIQTADSHGFGEQKDAKGTKAG